MRQRWRIEGVIRVWVRGWVEAMDQREATISRGEGQKESGSRRRAGKRSQTARPWDGEVKCLHVRVTLSMRSVLTCHYSTSTPCSEKNVLVLLDRHMNIFAHNPRVLATGVDKQLNWLILV
ncbi:hypothetical protein B296_00030931 [Ensete ventricosum]|uniref:Uncharacterized protein n=1 Tax=Ensete ventricosum TaxID=4639 RepID=A0A427A4X8_ENSVE|nr:hypothetical protein B296_00030931 [Ensete ventricosum]